MTASLTAPKVLCSSTLHTACETLLSVIYIHFINNRFVVYSQQNIPLASVKFPLQGGGLDNRRGIWGSNLDRSFISLLECGHKQPSLITIFQLAKAFNLTASKILSLVEEKIKK
jgi:hypothetical protein